MRAITVSSYGASPSATGLPTPQAGPGQVLIATQAAGMNPMDMQIANSGWQDQMPAHFPMVLGADLAGTVREDGPGAARFAPGDEVFGQLLIPPLRQTAGRPRRIYADDGKPPTALTTRSGTRIGITRDSA
jgi:NADPH:quinone reductase-like Zn-dependent oxidoreductase